MRRLLSDLVRQRSIALGASGGAMLVGVIVWIGTGMGEAAEMRSLLAAFAAVVAFAIGPQVTARYMERNIWYLPLSRREVWRARWIFASVVTPLCVVPALILPALVDRTANAAEAAALSILYAFAYAGFGCALIAIATRPIRASAPWRQLDAAAASLADILLPLAFLVPMLMRQFTPRRLPMHVGDITPVFGASLVFALGAWIAAYFYTPPPVGRTVRAYAASEATARRTSSASPRGARLTFRLAPGGWPLLLAHEYAWALLLASAFTLFAIVFVGIATRLWTSPQELMSFATDLLARFDGTSTPPTYGDTFFVTLLLLGIFASSLAARFASMLRHFRILPISFAGLNLLLVAWPAVIWGTAWLALLIIDFAILGHAPVTLHLPLFAALAGLSAAVRAVTLRFPHWGGTAVFALLVLAGVTVPALKPLGAAALAATAIVSILLALSLNRAALRRSATYRRGASALA